MKIEEKMIRRENEDVIEIGEILERFYNGNAGTIIRAMINGLTTKQFMGVEDNETMAAKKLGRAEGLQLLINAIEIAIEDKNRLTTPIKEEE